MALQIASNVATATDTHPSGRREQQDQAGDTHLGVERDS